jgi:hypothetical protein
MDDMQNYANHRKFVPAYHFVALPILLVNLGWQINTLRAGMTGDAAIDVATALALVIGFLMVRVMALRVQDRVIRLEMRLRLREMLPADMHHKIAQLSARQLVGLRFASDSELPSLVNQILKDNITNADTIKKMVKDWVADDLRA